MTALTRGPTAKDVILILLAKCHSNAMNGITRIEKLSFILALSPDFRDLREKLAFRPLHYGPYSDLIAESIEILHENDYIDAEPLNFELQISNRADEVSMEEMCDTKEFIETRNFHLTAKGKIIADHRYGELSLGQRREIDRIAKQYGQLDLKELIRRVYSLAPEDMLRLSRIREEMMCN